MQKIFETSVSYFKMKVGNAYNRAAFFQFFVLGHLGFFISHFRVIIMFKYNIIITNNYKRRVHGRRQKLLQVGNIDIFFFSGC